MTGVGTAIPIYQAIIRLILAVIVRALERCLDGERRTWISKDFRPEDALLLAPDRDPLAVKYETFVQSLSRDCPAGRLTEALHVVEDSQPQFQIEVEAHE